MSANPERDHLFKEAQKAYFANETAELSRLLKKLVKMGPYSPMQKRQLSNYYNILGDSDRALKVLGSIMGTHELRNASQNELAIQADIASKLVFHSANYTASRLFENVEENIKSEIRLGDVLDKWPYYKGQYLSYTFRSKESIPALEEALDFYRKRPESPEFKFSHLIYLKSLIDYGKYDEALKKAHDYEKVFGESDKKFLIYLDAIKAESMLALENTAKAKDLYELLIKKEKENNQQTTVATFYRMMGDIHRIEGNREQMNEYYLQSRAILEKFKYGPVFNWFPLLYSIETWSDLKHFFKHKIFIRLFPSYSPFTRLVEGTSVDAAIPPYYRDAFVESDKDTWYIHQKKITEIDYVDFLKKPANTKLKIIDLVAGRLKPAGTLYFESLTAKQSRCLRAVLGSGHLGIKHFHLLDYVYRQDFVDAVSGQERLRKVIASLRKNGFDIELKKNRYHYQPEMGELFLCPKMNRDANPLRGFRHLKRFERKDVEDFLGLKRTRAGELISQWVEEEQVETLSTGVYRTISGP